jgi:threonine dehydratase
MSEPVVSDEEYLRKILLAPVYEAAVQTPLSALTALSERYGRSIWLKREDRQPVHSFKVRRGRGEIEGVC